MDSTDQNNPVPASQDADLAKQYQDILDHYSQELANKAADDSQPAPPAPDVPETQPAAPEPVASIEPQIPLAESSLNNEDLPLTEVKPEPPADTPYIAPQAESPAPTAEPYELPPAPVFDTQVDPPKTSNFFKYLFFIALFIFLAVCGAIVYTVFFSGTAKNSSSVSAPPVSDISPTTIPTNVCQLNDHTYQVNETFAAADGCNTCTCTPDLTVSCTEKACESSSSATATPSAGLTSYNSSKYGFSFQYPSTAKVSGDLTSTVFTLSQNNNVVSFTILANPSNLSAKDFYLQQLNSQDSNSMNQYVTFSTKKYGTTTFTTAVQDADYFSQQSGGFNHYLLSLNGYVVNIQYPTDSTLLQQILTTLKTQ